MIFSGSFFLMVLVVPCALNLPPCDRPQKSFVCHSAGPRPETKRPKDQEPESAAADGVGARVAAATKLPRANEKPEGVGSWQYQLVAAATCLEDSAGRWQREEDADGKGQAGTRRRTQRRCGLSLLRTLLPLRLWPPQL